jgi:hypothetical protein
LARQKLQSTPLGFDAFAWWAFLRLTISSMKRP